MKTLPLWTALLLPLVCAAQTVSPNSAAPISAQLIDPSTGAPYSAGGTDVASPVIYSPNFQAPASIMLIDPATGQAYKASGTGTSVTLQTNGTSNTSQTTLNLQNGQGIVITNPSSGNVQIASTVPQRTVTTSPTIASTDMGGVIFMNVTGGGTLTVPAISSTVLASGMSVGVVNYSASTAAVSTTPTINSGGGCVTATGIPSGDTWQLISNGTTLDCIQTVSAATRTIATGTAALGTSAIASGSCATVVTVSATGVATTDVVKAGFNGDPTAVTGYGVSATGAVLTIYPYPTSNNVSFKVCNSSSGSITPGAMTLNWSVTR